MAQVSARPDRRWVPRFPFAIRIGWLEVSFLALALVALGLRLWELDGRTMHYDEAIHVHFAWKPLKQFVHSPWMHGPFQVEFTALIFKILGDTDFTARLGYALFGTALVTLPYFLRGYIGKFGAVLAAVMLALSPSLLYFSRFGRNDILMAFWVTSLLILMWRYLHEGKTRYLYLAAAVLAFMFATKETAYIVVLVFGALMFLLAVPDLVPWALGRLRLSQLAGAAGFLVLLITLTLPQWVALSGLAQDALGLTLVNPNGVTQGIVGAPRWSSPYVVLPVHEAAWWFHAIAAILLAGLLWWMNPLNRPGAIPREKSNWLNGYFQTNVVALLWRIQGIAVPLASIAAIYMALFRPIGTAFSNVGALAADFAIAAVLVGIAVASMVIPRHPWRRSSLLVLLPAVAAFLYLSSFTTLVDVDAVVNKLLPHGIPGDVSGNSIPINVLVAGGMLVAALAVSVYVGVRWLGARWLVCAAVFYGIWTTLYTTFFYNLAGMFSGVWLGMGYWIAQQDVARGNQPWYYYFVGLSVYELLPVIFGVIAFVYFLRRGDVFGLALSFWAGLTLLAYTVASEKMPWLLVNVTLPFILLAGKFLGELVETVRWRHVLRRGQAVLLILPPLVALAAVYLIYSYVNSEEGLTAIQWGVLAAASLLTVATAYLVRIAPPSTGMALAGLGLAGLLLAFGTWGAFRAAYTFDDSNVEILVYAQGSSDLTATFEKLDGRAFGEGTESAGPVLVDYDMWYPFQWYVRDQQHDGDIRFNCFKAKGEDGWNESCKPASEEQASRTLLLSLAHGGSDVQSKIENQREGPFRDLLWFPESYRRPNEDRPGEGSQWGIRGLPSYQQLNKDLRFFKDVATNRESWADIMRYLIFRDLDDDWYKSEYYSFLP